MAINVTVTDATDGISVTVQGGADTRTNVSDSGTQTVVDVTDLNFDQNLTVTDDGDGSATIDASGGGGSAVEVQEDGTSLTTDVTLIDVVTGLTASEPTADEIDLNLDESVLKDGGALELDVADLAGGLGTTGQVPQSDGAAVTWVTLPHDDLTSVGAADHHAKYTDEEAQDAVGAIADATLVYDDAGNLLGVASGGITTTELDLSIAPTWTGTHTFSDASVAFDVDDQAADPTANGEVTRNGTDVKVYSGGAVRNMTNIGSGGGSRVLVNTQSEGNGYTSGNRVVETNISSTYDHYIYEMLNVVPGNDGGTVEIQFSTDGGSTWENNSSDYRYGMEFITSGGTSGTDNNTGDFAIELTGGVGTAAAEGMSATLHIIEPTNSSFQTVVYWNGYHLNTAGVLVHRNGSGSRNNAESNDALRVQSSGQISEGTFSLYGVST